MTDETIKNVWHKMALILKVVEVENEQAKNDY